MTWFERSSSASIRPASFAQRRNRPQAPNWIVSSPGEATIVTGVFPARPSNDTPQSDVQELKSNEASPPTHSLPAPSAQERTSLPAGPASLVPSAAPQPLSAVPAPPDPALVQALEQSVAEIAQLRRRVLKQAEQQLVALAAKIARRVIGREISEDPRILLALASEGIEALAGREQTTVRVGDWMDDDAFESFRGRLLAQCPGCRVIQDSDLGPGGCVVETDIGRVDESLDTRLANVVAALVPGQEATQP